MNNQLFSNIASNTLTTLGALGGDANMAIASAVLSPIAVSISADVASRALSSIQSSRLEKAFSLIFHKCKIRKDKGENIRADSFMIENDGEQAKQVLEGVLLNICDEYERKKVNYHANFFTSLCFDERLVFEQAITVSKIIERLSFRQLSIIAYAYTQHNLKTSGWQAQFKDFPSLAKYGDFYSELFSLESLGIIQQDFPGQAIGGVPMKISEFGKILYEEVGLTDITEEDMKIIDFSINDINATISGKT